MCCSHSVNLTYNRPFSDSTILHDPANSRDKGGGGGGVLEQLSIAVYDCSRHHHGEGQALLGRLQVSVGSATTTPHHMMIGMVDSPLCITHPSSYIHTYIHTYRSSDNCVCLRAAAATILHAALCVSCAATWSPSKRAGAAFRCCGSSRNSYPLRPILCYAILYYDILYYAMLWYTMLCYAMLW